MRLGGRIRMMGGMTSTAIQGEGLSEGHQGRLVLRGLSSLASGEISEVLGAVGAGETTAVETVPAVGHQAGGRMRVRGFDPAEQRTRVRHLVIFPAPVL
jgi:ABC-type multidrug transport system ATPase subunit